MTVNTCEGNALRTVNATRTRFCHTPLNGLPRGIPGNPEDCVLQHAFRDLVPDETIFVQSDRIVCETLATAERFRRCWAATQKAAPWTPLQPREVALPRSLRLFIENFDGHQLPHLVLAA